MVEQQQDIGKQLYELQCAWYQWMHKKDRDRVEPGRSLLDLSREVEQAVIEPVTCSVGGICLAFPRSCHPFAVLSFGDCIRRMEHAEATSGTRHT